MTTRLVGGIAAASLAIGILTGAAGTIVASDLTRPRSDVAAVMADHMGDQGMASMMSGMMAGSMMGPGASFNPGMNGPAASGMPAGQHDQHHPAASQDDSK